MHVRATIGLILLFVVPFLSGCSFSRFAADRLGNAMAEGGSVYAADDDPELVGAAMPFGLKTIETLLAQSPNNRKLLLAAASGFTQYAYAFVQTEADLVEDTDLSRALTLRQRALKLYRRAFDYGRRGLEESQPGFSQLVRKDAGAALSGFRKSAVPLLYWTAAALGAAVSLDKTDPALSADLPLLEGLIRRALELDERYDFGTIHEFLIAYEGARPTAAGGSIERARTHFERAVQLSGGTRAAPFVSYAENVSVSTQNAAEFRDLLDKALAIDAGGAPEQRLANVIAQRRAKWLLSRMDRLFLD